MTPRKAVLIFVALIALLTALCDDRMVSLQAVHVEPQYHYVVEGEAR